MEEVIIRVWTLVLIFTALEVPAIAQTAASPNSRARDLGLSPIIGGTPGKLDSITDVAGGLEWA